MKRIFSIHTAFLFSLLLLAACGEVEIPEGTTEDTIVVTSADELFTNPDETDVETTDETDATETTTDDSDTDLLAADLEACEEEKDTLSDALELNSEALEQCESRREVLEARVEATSGGSSDSRYARYIDFYLENQTLTEFPFATCGVVGTFAGSSWYSAFQAALENKAIPFGGGVITTANLSGGCASEEGRMAFFLGAENQQQGLSEFHLLKYNFDTDTVEEALVIGAPYEIYPSQLGKRFGPYLTLTGRQGATEVEFWYYYADNILQPR